jgi:hypothetical protein
VSFVEERFSCSVYSIHDIMRMILRWSNMQISTSKAVCIFQHRGSKICFKNETRSIIFHVKLYWIVSRKSVAFQSIPKQMSIYVKLRLHLNPADWVSWILADEKNLFWFSIFISFDRFSRRRWMRRSLQENWMLASFKLTFSTSSKYSVFHFDAGFQHGIRNMLQ